MIKLLGKESRQLLRRVIFEGLDDDIFPLDPVTLPVHRAILNSTEFASADMTQFPLISGDVLTIHKLQGSTLEKLFVDSLIGCGLLSAYTVLTRVKKLSQLYFLQPVSPAMVAQWRLPQGLESEIQRIESISRQIIWELERFKKKFHDK